MLADRQEEVEFAEYRLFLKSDVELFCEENVISTLGVYASMRLGLGRTEGVQKSAFLGGNHIPDLSRFERLLNEFHNQLLMLIKPNRLVINRDLVKRA